MRRILREKFRTMEGAAELLEKGSPKLAGTRQ
jgi:hypothetical protein